MDFHLINKYLSGEATESEVEQIFHWIEASPENKKEFILYKKAWSLTAKSKTNKHTVWEEHFANRFRKKRLIRLYSTLAKYAAIFILFFGAGLATHYFFQNNKDNFAYASDTKIQVPYGQTANIELPDGSTVILNSGTSITYDKNFGNGKRKVNLEGEAFFDVAKDVKHPFLVQTSSLDFKVYGTAFNIEAYPEDKVINTTLIKGSLGINSRGGDELTRLKPGENACFNIDKEIISIQKVDVGIYTSWKDGLITFRNEQLKNIAQKIERWYNVEIIIENEKLGKEYYYGTILRNKPIDQILEVLKLTSSLEYTITSRAGKPTLIIWK